MLRVLNQILILPRKTGQFVEFDTPDIVLRDVDQSFSGIIHIKNSTFVIKPEQGREFIPLKE